MSKSPFKMDGKEISFTSGETVFEVARRTGNQLPSLCWDRRLDPAGSCRLCIVQVKGRPLPAASCTLRAEEGMEIETATDEIQSLQKTLLQMVLSENPPGECPRCRDIGICELHQWSDKFGAKRDRFAGRISNQSKEDPNPFILRDYDRCISCFRCTRICAEVEGDYAITPAGRGFDTRIATSFDQTLPESPCTFCGQCVYTCPTGALSDKKMVGQGSDRKKIDKIKTICPYCGTGCSLFAHAKEGKVIGVTPDLDGPANEGALCVKGQFGFDFISSPDRLKMPLVRKNGELQEVSWEEALTTVADRLGTIKKESGPKAFYAIASGRGPGEGAYMLQKFTRTVMGSNQIDNCSRG